MASIRRKKKMAISIRRSSQDPTLGYSRKHFVHADKRRKPLEKHAKKFLSNLLNGE